MKKLTRLASLLMISAGLTTAPLAAQAAPGGANVMHQAEKQGVKKQAEHRKAEPHKAELRKEKRAERQKPPKKAKPHHNVKKAKKKPPVEKKRAPRPDNRR